MSTLLSMLTLVPGGMGGSETYARELIRELSTRDLPLSTLVSPAGEGFSGSLLPEVVATEYPTGPSTRKRVQAAVVGRLRQRPLARRLSGAAVVHYPFTVRVPPTQRQQRSVVTLLDIQHHDLPQLFSRLERAYRSRAYDDAARDADAVITISDFAKNRICAQLGIESAKIHVASLGVRPDEFFPGGGTRKRFLLYPAKGWPHKNHRVLFEAWALFRERHPDFELVLTGASRNELPDLPAGVWSRGLIPRSELVELYGTAAALIFPSRYEGFGLPVVEAMASGCPVAASSAGALPEVVGDAGVLFDPDDAAGVARGADEAIDRSAELAARGVARASMFGWDACADVHERVYLGLGGLSKNPPVPG